MKPKKEHNYELRIGDSFYNSSKSYQTVQYQFKPAATIDRHKRGKLIKTHTNGKVKVLVEFANNTKTQPYSVGQGFYTECKDIECVLIFDGEKFQLERLSGIATGISLTKQSQPANDSDNLTSSLSEAEFQGFIQKPKDKNYTLITAMQNTNNSTHNQYNNHHNHHHKKPVRNSVPNALPVHTVNNTFHKANNSNTPSTTPSSSQTTTPSKPATVTKDDDRMSDDEDTGSEEDSEGSDDDSEGDTGDFTSRLMATIGDGTSTNPAPATVETVVSSNPFSNAPPSQTSTAPVAPPPTADHPMKGNDSSESSSEDSESGSSEDSESGSSEESESGSSESSSDESSESSSDSENK